MLIVCEVYVINGGALWRKRKPNPFLTPQTFFTNKLQKAFS